MFAAVIIQNSNKTGIADILNRLIKPAVTFENVNTEILRYSRLWVRADRWGNIDWHGVEQAVKRAGISNLLVPREARIPEYMEPMLCSAAEFSGVYCFRIARMIAREIHMQPGLKVGLIDIYGIQDSMAVMKMFSFASAVKVFTRNSSNYKRLKGWAGSRAESPLAICDTVDSLEDCKILIAPYGVDQINTHKDMQGVLVSSRFVPVSWKGAVIDGFEVQLPPDIDACRPPGIRAVNFAAALWKYNGLSPLSRLPLSKLSCRGRAVDLKEICTTLDSFPSV